MAILSLAQAQRVIEVAQESARKLDVKIGITVVDARGDVKASARCDGASFRAMQISLGKAYASATHGVPSGDLVARADSAVMRALMHLEQGRIIPAPGAVPLRKDGELIGAVGISGAPTAEADVEIALAGAAALEAGV